MLQPNWHLPQHVEMLHKTHSGLPVSKGSQTSFFFFFLQVSKGMVGGSPGCFSTFGHFTFRRLDQKSPEIRGSRNWVVGLPKDSTEKFKGGGDLLSNFGGCKTSMILLMMEKTSCTQTCMKPSKSWDMGIFTISTDAEFLPSVSMISIPLNHPIYPFPILAPGTSPSNVISEPIERSRIHGLKPLQEAP